MRKAQILLVLWSALPIAAAPVEARPAQDFTEAAFAAASANDQPVLIDAYAPWCTACRVQEPILDQLTDLAPYRGVVVLRIGMLTPEAVWRRLRIDAYGTLVLLKHGKEKARATPTTEMALRRLLDTAG